MSLFSRTKNTPPPKKPADYALFRQSPSDQTPQTPSDDIIDVQPTETPSPTPSSSPFNQTPTSATSDSPSSNASNTFFSAKPTTPSQPDQPVSSSDAKKPSRFSLPPLFKAKPKPASTSTTPPSSSATPAAKNTLLPFAILSVILALASAGARYYTQISVDDLRSQITTLQNKMPAALASQLTPWTDTSSLFSAMETSAPSTYSYIATPKSINLSLTYPLQHPYTEYDFAPLDPANLPFLQNAAYPCHGSSSSTPTDEPASVSLTLSCISTTTIDPSSSSSSASTPTSPQQ